MVTRSSRRTPAVDVERSLLEAAHRLLERDGIDAVTVRAVAAEAGVAPMGLYHRFGGKDGLVESLFNDGFDALTAALLDRPAGAPMDELLAGCLQYRRFALAHRALYGVMFERVVPGLGPGTVCFERCGRAFNVLVNGVLRAQAAGDVRAGDAFDIAQQLWDACHGAVSIELRGIGFVSDREAHYESLMRTMLAGLAPPV